MTLAFGCSRLFLVVSERIGVRGLIYTTKSDNVSYVRLRVFRKSRAPLSDLARGYSIIKTFSNQGGSQLNFDIGAS